MLALASFQTDEHAFHCYDQARNKRSTGVADSEAGPFSGPASFTEDYWLKCARRVEIPRNPRVYSFGRSFPVDFQSTAMSVQR